jgi:glycogen synthase
MFARFRRSLGGSHARRIAYISGPCDALSVHTEWRADKKQDYFGCNYMMQFLQLCEDLQADAYVVTTLPGGRHQTQIDRFIFDNHPSPSNLSGAFYHLAFLPWSLRIILRIIRFRPHALILTAHCSHWFLFFCLRWLRITIVPSFDVVPWPKFLPRKRSSRVLWQLNRWLLLRHVKAIIVTSDDIGRQVVELLGGAKSSEIEIVKHLPTYSRSQFETVARSQLPAPTVPFRVLFAGRIETHKGIYDVLEIARRLDTERHAKFQFDICGNGSELSNLRRRVSDMGLEDAVFCHGYCDVEKFTAVLSAAQAWIVPTRTEFAAGFEMVCAEAILSRRPLITSAVCPALEYVRDAAIEVQPNNVDQYCRAIIDLCDEKALYEGKWMAALVMQDQFYETSNSWMAKVKLVLQKHLGFIEIAGTRLPGQPPPLAGVGASRSRE